MTYGTAQRGAQHPMGTSDAVYVPRWRVIASLVVARDQEGRNHHCYAGDTLAWLSDTQAKHFLRMKLVERIAADAIAEAPAEPADLDGDSDADTADSGAADECIGVLRSLQVPAAAGAPACRTALRDNGHRYGNAVVAAAVKRRKALSDDDENFAVVVAR